MYDFKCYNPDCSKLISYEVTGSAYCSDECKAKSFGAVQPVAKGPKKYKSIEAIQKRCRELAVEAKDYKEKFGDLINDANPYAELFTPLAGFDNTPNLFHN